MNKENNSRTCNTSRTANTHHPSDQSQCRQYRPSIKVGYKIVPCVSEQKEKRMATRRKIQPNYTCQQKVNCKKMLTESSQGRVQASGKFINSEYIKQQSQNNTKQQPTFSKKSVPECRQKNQNSEQIKNNLIAQFSSNININNSRRSCSVSALHNNSNIRNDAISQSRSRLSQLPSYKKAGIKDIMEYQHALPYREVAVTEKCTKSNAMSRFFKYEQLHEFDFRKRPEFLR